MFQTRFLVKDPAVLPQYRRHIMNPASHSVPRRKFLAASAAALGLAPLAYLRAQQGSPNDEIAMGVVGCGGQGMGNMGNFLNIKGVRVVAVCDVDADRAKAAKAQGGRFLQEPGLQDLRQTHGSSPARRARCGESRDPGPLARQDRNRRRQCRQGCLRRETLHLGPRGRPLAGGCPGKKQTRLANRLLAALRR